MTAGVYDLEARIAECPGDDLRPAVMAIEPWLGDEHTDRGSKRHATDRSAPHVVLSTVVTLWQDDGPPEERGRYGANDVCLTSRRDRWRGGIGEAIARRLASDGTAVAILDVDGAAATATAATIAKESRSQVVGLACDIASRAQISETIPAAADALGGLDGLITNAGIARDGFLHKMDDDAWDAVIAVHLTGTFACLRAASPWLRTEGQGRVVCISSISAAMGNRGQANYTAAKGGIVSLVKTAALELARYQTTVNAIRPGFHRHRDDPGSARRSAPEVNR